MSVFRSGRISSVYIVGCGSLWVTLLSKLVNFECVGMCWNILECVESVGMSWNVLEYFGMCGKCWNVLEYFGMCGKCCNMFEWVRMCWNVLEFVGVFVPWRPGKPW